MRAPVYDGPHSPACSTCTLMASSATSLTSDAVLISRSSRLRRHCCFDRAREPLFEIDDADPFRTDADPQHLREHLLHLTDPRLTLLFPKVSLGTRDILRNDTFYCLSFRFRESAGPYEASCWCRWSPRRSDSCVALSLLVPSAVFPTRAVSHSNETRLERREAHRRNRCRRVAQVWLTGEVPERSDRSAKLCHLVW